MLYIPSWMDASIVNLLSSFPTRSREHFNISSMQIVSFIVELLLFLPSSELLHNLLPPFVSPFTTEDQEIRIIQGRNFSSKNLLYAEHLYSKDGKLLTDSIQSWRCAKKSFLCLERLYNIHLTFHCLGKSHDHPLDAANSSTKQSTTFFLPYTLSKHQRKRISIPTDVKCGHQRGRQYIW